MASLQECDVPPTPLVMGHGNRTLEAGGVARGMTVRAVMAFLMVE